MIIVLLFKGEHMNQDTIELDEFVTLYSGYLSEQLNKAMQDAWKEDLWKKNKENYIQQFREKNKHSKWIQSVLLKHNFIEDSISIPAYIITFIGAVWQIFSIAQDQKEDTIWNGIVSFVYIFIISIIFYGVAFLLVTLIRDKILIPKAQLIRRWIKERQKEFSIEEEAQKDFFSEEIPKIKGEFILSFCLNQADDIVKNYTKELRTKKKEAFDFIKRQEEYTKEVQSTFSSDSEKGKSLLKVIKERIFHTKFRMQNIDEMIAQSQQFQKTLKQKAQQVVQKMKDREAEQRLANKIQQDNGDGLDLNLIDDEEMLDSFQTLETFLSESSCFVDMVQEMDNDFPT